MKKLWLKLIFLSIKTLTMLMMLIQILFKNIGKVAPVKNKRLGFMFIKRFIKKLDIACRISLQKRKMKLKECIGKPKDFWKAIKSLGPPSKSGGCIAGALAENEIKKHDTKSILKTFKCFYLNLARIFFCRISEVAKPCLWLLQKTFVIWKFQIGLNNWRLFV